MSIRAEFPDEESLQNYYRTNADYFVSEVKAGVGSLETEYVAKLKKRKQGMIFLGAAFVLFSIFGGVIESDINITNFLLIFLSIFALPVAGVLAWIGQKKIKGTAEVINAFNNGLNDTVYPTVFKIFGLPATRIHHSKANGDEGIKSDQETKKSIWTRNINITTVADTQSPETKTILALLDHSELITEPRNTIVVDDMISSEFAERSLFFAELNAQHITGSGKNRRVKQIFHGYFISYDLPRELSGKTFVSTEGDQKGFGHQSFFKSLRGQGVEKTELEWNDFESLLHVVSDNPTEARYILTPDFMQDLYDWWLGRKQNIRIAFLGQRMYMLFPNKNIRVGNTIKKIESEEVVTYLESIGLPLLHVLHLVEDLET